MNTPPAGWHPDPEDNKQLRYWDGQQWTSATQPMPTPQPTELPPETPEAAKKRKQQLIAAGVIIAVIASIAIFNSIDFGKGDTETAAAETTTTQAADTEPSLPDDAIDQAGVACVEALGPKVDTKSPMIRNHSTKAVNDTFVTVGQVSKYVGGENPRNYQFECTTRFDGKFTAEVTQFTELARTEILTQSASPTTTTTASKPAGCRDTPAEYLDIINASFLDGYSFGETKAIQRGEFWYIGGQIHNAEGGIRSRDDLFVAKDMIVTPVTVTARNQSTLPDLRKILDVSFSDPAATAALDCARTY